MSGLHHGSWSSTSDSNSHSIQLNHDQSDTHPTVHSTKTKPGINEYDRLCRVHPADRQIVEGFTRMVTDRVNDGWSCHLLTFMFSQLPGPRGALIQSMRDEVHRVYSTLVTRTHRKPRTASPDEIPFLIGVADLPVYKRDRDSSALVLCNGGLHFHALLLVPPDTRLDVAVDEHFRANEGMYLGKRGSLVTLDVRPITGDHDRVVDTCSNRS